jgi:hypothetical protein
MKTQFKELTKRIKITSLSTQKRSSVHLSGSKLPQNRTTKRF